jgi:hypothetical protein
METKFLLAEGIRDANFLEALCRKFGIKNVTVKPPSTLGAQGDGWGNTIRLAETLARQMVDGQVGRLAITTDADHTDFNDRGYKQVSSGYREMLRTLGYARPPIQIGTGAVYAHDDGLPSIGVWIMPNNTSDGMIEDFILNAVAAESAAWLEKARQTVASLDRPLFDRQRHDSKAIVSTWLAWQRMPGKQIVSTVGDGLIDLETTQIQNLRQWLLASLT